AFWPWDCGNRGRFRLAGRRAYTPGHARLAGGAIHGARSLEHQEVAETHCALGNLSPKFENGSAPAGAGPLQPLAVTRAACAPGRLAGARPGTRLQWFNFKEDVRSKRHAAPARQNLAIAVQW